MIFKILDSFINILNFFYFINELGKKSYIGWSRQIPNLNKFILNFLQFLIYMNIIGSPIYKVFQKTYLLFRLTTVVMFFAMY